MHFPFGHGSRNRELAEVNQRIEALHAEIADLERSLDAISDEFDVTQAQRIVERLRGSIVRSELAEKREELATLTSRADALQADIGERPSGAFPTLDLPNDLGRRVEAPAEAAREQPPVETWPTTLRARPLAEPVEPAVAGAPVEEESEVAETAPEPVVEEPEPAAEEAEPVVEEAEPVAEEAEPVAAEAEPVFTTAPGPDLEEEPAPPEIQPEPIPAEALMPAAPVALGPEPVEEPYAHLAPGAPEAEAVVAEPSRQRRVAMLIGAVLVVLGGGAAVAGLFATGMIGRAPQPAAQPTSAVIAALPTTPPTGVPTVTRAPTLAPTVAPTAAPTAAPAVAALPSPASSAEVSADQEAMVSEPDEEEAETPPDVASPVAVATGRIYAPGFNGVNLRRAPSTTGGTIRALPVGTTVTILSGQATANGLVWQQVRTTNGEVGWVSAGTVLR